MSHGSLRRRTSVHGAKSAGVSGRSMTRLPYRRMPAGWTIDGCPKRGPVTVSHHRRPRRSRSAPGRGAGGASPRRATQHAGDDRVDRVGRQSGVARPVGAATRWRRCGTRPRPRRGERERQRWRSRRTRRRRSPAMVAGDVDRPRRRLPGQRAEHVVEVVDARCRSRWSAPRAAADRRRTRRALSVARAERGDVRAVAVDVDERRRRRRARSSPSFTAGSCSAGQLASRDPGADRVVAAGEVPGVVGVQALDARRGCRRRRRAGEGPV